MLFGSALAPIVDASKLYSPCDIVGPIFANSHQWRPISVISVFDAVDGIAKRSGGALFHDFDYLFCICAVGVYPRALPKPENRSQAVDTFRRMRANGSVVMNCYFLSDKVF